MGTGEILKPLTGNDGAACLPPADAKAPRVFAEVSVREKQTALRCQLNPCNAVAGVRCTPVMNAEIVEKHTVVFSQLLDSVTGVHLTPVTALHGFR